MRILTNAQSSELQSQPAWTDSNLPPSQFLYKRKGPWPQPEPAYPMTRPPEVLNIPTQESRPWWEFIGSRLTATFEIEKFLAHRPGCATIGAIGFEGRRDYAAIGNVTNLAARLCAKAGAAQILISNVVAEHIEKLRPAQHFATLTLKGFSKPVECYEITAVQQISHAQNPVHGA